MTLDRALFEKTPALLQLVDSNGEILKVSDYWLKKLGYESDEVIGKKIAKFSPKNAILPIYFQTEDCRDLPYQLVKKNGENIDLLLSASAELDESGRVLRSLAILTESDEDREVISEQTDEEQKLLDSEILFRQIVENIREILWIADIDLKRILYVSPAYEEIWGRTCESLQANPSSYLEAIYPEDCEHLSIKISLLLECGQAIDEEYRIVRPDGTMRWIRDRVFPIRNEAGQVYRIAGIAEDITHFKQIEHSVRERLEFEQLLSCISAELINSYDEDLDGVIVESLGKIARHYRFDRAHICWISYEERLGYIPYQWSAAGIPPIPSNWKHLTPEQVSGWMARLKTIEPIEIGSVRDFSPEAESERQILIESATKSLFIVPLQSESKLMGYIAFATVREERIWPENTRKLIKILAEILFNTLRRKNKALQLQQSEAKFRTLVSTPPIMVWMSGTDGKCNFISEGLRRFTGKDSDNLMGDAWLEEEVAREDRHRYLDAYHSAFEQRREFQIEYRVKYTDGKYRWISESGAPIFAADREFMGYIGSCIDIHEFKITEAALKQQLEFDRLVATISTRFINLPSAEIDASINRALQELGEFAEVDGCYLFQIREGSASFDATHKWVATHWKTTSNRLESLSFADFPWTSAIIRQDLVLNVPDIEDLPLEAAADQKNWQIFSLKSFICIPLGYQGRISGWVGFVTFERQKYWCENRIGLLKIVGEIFTNALQRQQTETVLREIEENFCQLAEHIDKVFFIQNLPSLEVVYVSPAFTKIWGQSCAVLYENPRAWTEFIHPEDRDRIAVLREKIQTEATDTEYRIVRNDGEIRWIWSRTWTVASESGEIYRLVGTAQDITERKLAEVALRQSEARLRMALEVGKITCWEYDLTTQLVSGLGSLGENWLPRVWQTTLEKARTKISPDEQERMSAELLSAIESRGEFEIEHTTIAPEGTSNWALTKGRVLDDSRGKPGRVVGLSMDITDRVRAREKIEKLNEDLEKRVRERTEQLENSNKELESFSYSISHDLRAPLRHINGFVQLLRQKLESNHLLEDRDIAEYLQIIQDSGSNLEQMIDGLLTLSRLGRRKLITRLVDSRQLVETAIDLALPLTERDSGRVHFQIGELPTLNGDRSLLQVVFTNLISNAVKFSSDKTPAIVEIGSLADETIFVRDNGVGFSMRYADRLFNAFCRLHSKKRFSGNGIGLSVVHRIVSRHGGRIWVESAPDCGATFYFHLGQRFVTS